MDSFLFSVNDEIYPGAELEALQTSMMFCLLTSYGRQNSFGL
jgi:hypothetical protein